MTICSGCKVNYCLNSCCYFAKKEVYENEAVELGLENMIIKGDKYFLKPKHEGFSACIFLDEEEGKCAVYEKRPTICSIYDCQGDSRIDLMFQEVMFISKKDKKR